MLIVRENGERDSRTGRVRPIARWMGGLSDIAWIGIGLIAGFGMLHLLRALAITVRNETMIQDLRVGVAEIQVERFHKEMLRQGNAPTVKSAAHGEVEILEDEGPAPESRPGEARGGTAGAGEADATEAETEPARRAA